MYNLQICVKKVYITTLNMELFNVDMVDNIAWLIYFTQNTTCWDFYIAWTRAWHTKVEWPTLGNNSTQKNKTLCN